MIRLLKNFSYTILSNLGNALVSMLVVFIIPKIISPHDYGMFQIFLFYFSYAGLIQFGWLDGIYLRYGGAYYNNLDKSMVRGQFQLYTIVQTIICLVVELYALFFMNGPFVLLTSLVVIGVLVTNGKTFFQFILQLTNRISEFSISAILSALIYALLVILSLISNLHNYYLFIWANIIGQICALAYGIYTCRDIFLKNVKPKYSFNEVKFNVIAGIKLSLSSIAGMLILGIVRLGVQMKWSVATFGKVSLILSICNLLMLFINAASLVLFPILKRINDKNMLSIYQCINLVFMPFLYILLFIYYPVALLINLWLPQYHSILIFMAILFPLGLYQGKFEVLSNTFYKVWRMESLLLLINIISLIISVIFTLIFTLLFKNLNLLILSIIFTLAIRSFLSDIILYDKKSINIFSSFFKETVMVFIFILTNNFLQWYLALVINFCFFIVIWMTDRKRIKNAFNVLKNIDYESIE